MATPNFPTRQLVSTPWDQLLADTETDQHKQKEAKSEEPIPLHIRVRERCERTWIDLDEATGSRGTKNVQSDHIMHPSTTSTEATEIMKDFLFEVQYMACWEAATRGNAEKNPLREVILRVNYGCAKLCNPDKKRLLELVNVLIQIYYRILGTEEGPSAKSKHCYYCLDRLEFIKRKIQEISKKSVSPQDEDSI